MSKQLFVNKARRAGGAREAGGAARVTWVNDRAVGVRRHGNAAVVLD